MLYTAAVFICIFIPALVIQALILKGTTVAFGKRGLNFRTTTLITQVLAVLSVCTSILGRLGSTNTEFVIFQVLCISAFFVAPIIVVKKALQIRTIVSIGIIVITIIASGVVGIAYAYGVRTYFVQAFRIPSAGMSPT